MKSKLYGIGVGPGDSEYLTIKGKRIINEVDILLCPIKSLTSESFAFNIIKEHIENEKLEIVNLLYPMVYDENELENMWQKNGEIINSYLEKKKNIAFITLGDTTVYSTFMYTLPYINKALMELEIIPGITSFCAVASEIQQPLMLWEESLKIIPVRKNDKNQLNEAIKNNENLVLMKPSNNPIEIIKMLKENNLEDKFMLISKVGTDDEMLIRDIKTLENEKLPYLSTIIIKKGGFNV
ncbi:MAG: precorrin-2 C(20)-methyltransferase [Bacillota bacterium]|nr:precorrin-2 C(20)-methyltransferase [Bacillota bacterium]